MNKYIGFITLAGLIISFCLVAVVRAADNSVGTQANPASTANSGIVMTPISTALHHQMQSERQSFIAKLQADSNTFMNGVKSQKQNFENENESVKTQFCQTTQSILNARFQSLASAIESIQGKVSNLIDQLSNSGADTSTAADSLTASEQEMADAQSEIDSLKSTLPSNCQGVTSDEWQTLKLGVGNAKDLLQQSREDLHQTIQYIQALSQNVSGVSAN
jgi:chromosome segregation ATPase